MTFHRSVSMVLVILSSAYFATGIEQWPQFRGPSGQGISESKGLPLKWGDEQNIGWQTPIHGRAWSSPVIWDKQVWLTTATEDGRELFALCIDLDSGRVARDLKLFDVPSPQFAHKFNTYASPTPVVEAGRVYVTFGSPGTACIDTATGKVLWERRDFVCNHFRGAGSSPIVHQDLLILHFDGSDHQFLAALDKRTGKTVWQTKRSIDYQDLTAEGKPEADGDMRKAFATPHIARFAGASPILLSQGSKAFYAYEPDTGKEIWRFEDRSAHSASTRPTVGPDMIYFSTGFSRADVVAIRPGGKGVLSPAQVAWRQSKGVPNKPSFVLWDGLLFMINDGGIATCLDTKDGTSIWTERIGGSYSASPIVAHGRIYFFSEEGKTTIVEAGRHFKILGQNQLGDGFMASPAVAGNALILRSRTHLLRIEDAGG